MQYTNIDNKVNQESKKSKPIKRLTRGLYFLAMTNYLMTALCSSFLTLVISKNTLFSYIGNANNSIFGSSGLQTDVATEMMPFVDLAIEKFSQINKRISSKQNIESYEYKLTIGIFFLSIVMAALLLFIIIKAMNLIDAMGQYKNLLKMFFVMILSVTIGKTVVLFSQTFKIIVRVQAKKLRIDDEKFYVFACAFFAAITVTLWPYALSSSMAYLQSISASADVILFVRSCFSTWFIFLGVASFLYCFKDSISLFFQNQCLNNPIEKKVYCIRLLSISFSCYALSAFFNNSMKDSSLKLICFGLAYGVAIISRGIAQNLIKSIFEKYVEEIKEVDRPTEEIRNKRIGRNFLIAAFILNILIVFLIVLYSTLEVLRNFLEMNDIIFITFLTLPICAILNTVAINIIGMDLGQSNPVPETFAQTECYEQILTTQQPLQIM